MNKNKLLTTLVLILSALVVGITACDKIEDMIKFTFKDTANISIPSQSVIDTGPIIIQTPEFQTSSQQAFSQNNTQAKYVKEAKLSELKLTITAPDNQTFSFLNEVRIYINVSGQNEVLVASKTNIPTEVGKELLLDLADVNLKPYIQGQSYNIRTEAVIDEAILQEVEIRADMTFSVTAEVF